MTTTDPLHAARARIAELEEACRVLAEEVAATSRAYPDYNASFNMMDARGVVRRNPTASALLMAAKEKQA